MKDMAMMEYEEAFLERKEAESGRSFSVDEAILSELPSQLPALAVAM